MRKVVNFVVLLVVLLGMALPSWATVYGKKFCEEEKKAPLCEDSSDCAKRLKFSLIPTIGRGWAEYMGDLDEEGAIKVECDYQRKHHCVQPKCKGGSE